MKKHLLKTLLVGVMTLAATGAWAAEKAVVKYSFDDANSPALTAGNRSHLDYSYTSVISKTTFLNIWADNNSTGATNITLGDTDLSAETWTLQFDWAGYSGCNGKTGHTYLKAGDTNLFDIVDAASWGKSFTLNYGSSTADLSVYPCNKGNRISAATGSALNTTDYWYHFTIVGSTDGVKLTIAPSNGGDAVVTDAVLSETNVNPTSIAINPGSCGSVAIDELLLTYYVEGEVVQTPLAAYTGVDGINRTITATCDTEGATLYYSTDGENWTEGAEVTVSESGKIYFKAVKGTAESDVLEFDAVAGEAIVLNAPLINRTSDTSVTITADQSNLLLSPDATIVYQYGAQSGTFTGSLTLTVEEDAVITAFAEYDGYTTSATSERAVALFPIYVEQIENTATRTSGWSAQAFSEETITASERTYAALLLDEEQWGENVYLQTDGAWGLRASGNWYINSDTEESWILMQNLKKGDIVVVDITYPASSMVNATYSKYAYGTRHAYEVTEDGSVELAFKKINTQTMDYLYGVYAYREVEVTPKNIYLAPAIWDAEDATERYAAYAFNSSSVNEWFDFAAEKEGIFTAAIPNFYNKIILVRMNGETTENNWDNKWNQTDDIDFTAVADNTLFTITGWGEGEGAKSTYETSEYVVLNTYTATFTTSAEWEKVYAYAFTTTGEGEEATTTEFLGAWPGTELTKNAETGLYEVTIEAAEAPAYIIFNNGNGGEGNQTENLAFENEKAYEYTVVIPATDIDLTVEEGDIAAALAAAEEGIAKVGNITIHLNKEAAYTVGATLTAPNSIFFYGNDATVTVAEDFAGDFITLDGTEAFAMKSETEASDHKLIGNVEVRGVTIKGLQGSVVKDAQKTFVETLVIDYANIQMPAAGKNVLDFNGKGYAGKVEVTYSTIWANGMNTGFFAQYNSRPKNINGDWLQEFVFENNTIVNIANGKNFNNFNQKGTAQNVYTVKNNIFVNCGKDKQVIVGMNSGQTSATPVWDVEGNYFMVGDACTNADEVAKAGQKDGEDIVKNCVEGTLTFTDADNGDFNGEFTLAAGATAPETAIGAPAWTITYKEAEPVINYYVVGSMTSWKIDEDYLMTLNDGAEGVEEYKLTVELENGDEIKVVKAVNGEITTWYPDGEGNNYTITADKKYNIYFRPNADGGDDWHYKVLYVVDTDTDGINSLSIDMQNAAVYDLQGRRVQNAQKGLYIVNGKKVVKN